MSVSGKVTLITGAGSGIGRACALAFASAGARVVVADRDGARGAEVAGEIVAGGGEGRFVPVDVAVPEMVREMVRQTVDHYGQLDVLISNAGIGGRAYGDGPVHEASVSGWETIMNVNVRGTFLACKYAIPHLLATQGNIITMASILGLVGSQSLYDTHIYMTSKAAIIGLTRTIAAYYAKDRLRANCLAPGLVDTRMAERTKADPDLLEQIAFWQPLGPIGEVQDVAAAALFLASDRAKFITGVVLPVDGGWHTQ
jgi:NAD(P)-dependent dehydrogenase (short-subunit alcohol dehydrogenase family)